MHKSKKNKELRFFFAFFFLLCIAASISALSECLEVDAYQ